jgi:signal transduction histidine kinase
MRSIRLALVVYFLLLLGLVLGAVSVPAYRHSRKLLEENEKARSALLESLYQNDCRKVNETLDQQLIHRAELLADRAVMQFKGTPMLAVRYVTPLRALAAAIDPNSALPTAFWVGQDTRNGCVQCIQRQLVTEIKFPEKLPDPEETNGEYFQINNEWGTRAWRSESLQALGDSSFPFDQETFRQTPQYDPKLDEIDLGGLHLRRVIFKAPISRFSLPFFPRHPGHGKKPDPGVHSARAILIQVGAPTAERDARLAALEADKDNALAGIKTEAANDLAHLFNLFVLVGLATFAMCLAGGFLLVRAGLSPLHRLSVAVSKVSAKDFRLPFEERHLPSELRPIVDRLCQTLELLKRAFAREKQAAADISHELRTPLAALLTTTEVGLRKERTPEEYRELLTDCHSAGQQMSHLVERLLALARLDAGVDQLRYQSTNVNLLAEECAEMVRPLAEARGLKLQVHRNGPVQVHVDADKLREILNNLLHNAIDYNRPHGQVDMTVVQENGRLRLKVADTGIGIAPDVRERIFERFYRADVSREATGLHAGLGLAIVKGYVDLMGGTITVDSAIGQGSTFQLELPVRKT